MKPYGEKLRAVSLMYTDVSEVYTASIIRAVSDDGGSKHL
jgi:hypothetical protein